MFYVKLEQRTGFGPGLSLAGGILSILAGLMILLYPSAGAWALVVLFPIWFIAHCISRLSHLNHIRLTAGEGMYYFTLATNIIGLILGLMMLLNPLFTLTTIRCFASIYLILLGIDSIAMAVSRIGTRF